VPKHPLQPARITRTAARFRWTSCRRCRSLCAGFLLGPGTGSRCRPKGATLGARGGAARRKEPDSSARNERPGEFNVGGACCRCGVAVPLAGLFYVGWRLGTLATDAIPSAKPKAGEVPVTATRQRPVPVLSRSAKTSFPEARTTSLRSVVLPRLGSKGLLAGPRPASALPVEQAGVWPARFPRQPHWLPPRPPEAATTLANHSNRNSF
jgi:hypothetical protein